MNSKSRFAFEQWTVFKASLIIYLGPVEFLSLDMTVVRKRDRSDQFIMLMIDDQNWSYRYNICDFYLLESEFNNYLNSQIGV